MAYDEDLADRVRALLGGESRVSEQRMFGGLAFLIGGNMGVAVSGRGGILVRVVPDEADDLIASGPAEPAVMGGRRMRGWVVVGKDDLRDDGALSPWIARGAAYARSLPPKERGRR
ncbi:MAG: TfoX/Sxy family protein [Actinomycetes bacterium]